MALLKAFHMPVHAQLLSYVQLFAAPWTIAHQAPLSIGFFQARKLDWVAISSSRASSQFESLASPA